MNQIILDRIIRVVALLVLGAAVAERISYIPPASAARYHERVKAAVAGFPLSVGNWTATEYSIPAGARRLLRPNVIMSRAYTNVTTGRSCKVLLVHCSDARDLLAHYPPNCYPGSGWKQVASMPARWEGYVTEIDGTMYDFSRGQFESAGGIGVGNVMILPDGRFSPNMEGVEEVASDPRRRHFGVAQLQVIVDGATSDLERADVMKEMLVLHGPLLRAIQSPGD